MLTRKKSLKIQDRLGMRVGIAYGTYKKPNARTTNDVLEVLSDLYQAGFKAFVLAPELFEKIQDSADIYKEHYSDLLKIRNLAAKYNIELAVRAESLPEDPVKLDTKLKIYFTVASIMDCRMFIMPPNFYTMMPKDQAVKLIVHKINEILNGLNLKLKIGIETTGKVKDVGSLEDVLEIAKRATSSEPVLNFAHIHARGSGALRSENDFKQVIDTVRRELGSTAIQNPYMLFSGVKYGPSGEIQHIPFKKADIDLNHLIKAIMTFGTKGTLIFEDPEREKGLLDMLKDFGEMVR